MFPELFRIFVRSNRIISAEYCEPETPRIHLQFIHQKVPRKLDRIFFEVIAERKIPEHLEESLVTRGLADFIQVVVLATGAQTFLR